MARVQNDGIGSSGREGQKGAVSGRGDFPGASNGGVFSGRSLPPGSDSPNFDHLAIGLVEIVLAIALVGGAFLNAEGPRSSFPN